jgi:hypothetical protein
LCSFVVVVVVVYLFECLSFFVLYSERQILVVPMTKLQDAQWNDKTLIYTALADFADGEAKDEILAVQFTSTQCIISSPFTSLFFSFSSYKLNSFSFLFGFLNHF